MPGLDNFESSWCSSLLFCYRSTTRCQFLVILFLWTIVYIWIGVKCLKGGTGDIDVAIFNFITAVGIVLMLNVLFLGVRPVATLWTTHKFNKAYLDDSMAESLYGVVVDLVPQRNSFRITIDYTVLVQVLEIIVHTQEEIDVGSSVELRVLRWHPRSGMYPEEWKKRLGRVYCINLLMLVLGMPFLVYYVWILVGFTDLGGFPYNMVLWHLLYIVPPTLLYWKRRSIHVTESIVHQAIVKQQDAQQEHDVCS